jgi:maleate isomerase
MKLPDPAQAYAAQRIALATITPSGNTVVERITVEALRALPQVSAHFSRIPVHGASDPSPEAYAMAGLLAAAELLAHAQPQVLLWNGSKGTAIGFAHDRALATALHAATGIPTTTSTLALDAARREFGLVRIGLVSPHVTPYQHKLIKRLQAEGFEVIAEAHAGVADNLAYAAIPLPDIAAMMRRVAAARPQAVLSLCTNFPGAPLCAAMETELGLPVLDTVTLGLWQALKLAGVDPSPLASRWGRVFAS